jgi:serine/threonine protein kinase
MDGNHHLLENEVGAWTQLRHTTADASHFLGIRFFDFTGEYRVVALEWMDGEPLSVFLKKSQPKELVLSIIRELVAILVELGRAGIVHRDFTPDNLLVALSSSANPRPLVLIDFACAVIGGVAPLDRFVPLIDLLDLCNGYKPQEYLWDDAYSCLRIYELIDQATGVVDTACQAQVVKRLASLTYSFDKEAAEQVRMGRFETKDTSCE